MYKLIMLILMLGTDSLPIETIQTVELSYQTRGMQKSLRINRDSIIVTINGKVTDYQTTNVQWQRILKTSLKVKLGTISSLKRPSTKSFHDGAMMAHLKIVTNLKEYNSVDFDHDMPPSKLGKLIGAMKYTLINTKNEEDF